MSEIKDGGPAFPVTYEIENGPPDNAIPGHLYPGSKSTVVCSGLTVRDYFAAKSMQARLSDYEGMVSLHEYAKDTGQEFSRVVAEQSYDMADAMLRVRDKP
jgi:hypothetical protein